jgi:cytochrome c-type biogenesis protein CcmF
VAVLVACVAAGVRGLNPLLAFGLGAFAGASALRQLVLATRRQGWRGLVGRANGGMVVHIGVVLIAVAFAASHSFADRTDLSLKAGQPTRFGGHTFTFLGIRDVSAATHSAIEAQVRIDGGRVYAPAISDYPFASEEIGTPSVRSQPTEDIYLTLVGPPAKAGDPAVIGVLIEPLVMWIWIGGGVIILGTILSAWPGRRRRPTDPVSAPVAERRASAPETAGGDGATEPADVTAGTPA